jgi:bifunctional non-homologous end joining protein LigD
MKTESELEIDGRVLKVSNLDKVMYPSAGFTKGQIIDYYVRVSPCLLPHLKNHPLVLKRYPNGVEAAFFYEKRCPSHRPEWVQTAPIVSESSGEEINYCVINDLPALVWAANLADIELHSLLAKCKNPNRPTVMVFDLDPGPPAHILHCVEVAFWLRELFDGLKVECFPKTSGSKGLQLYVPLNTPVTFDETKSLAKTLAELLAQRHPRQVVSKMSKALRKGKVFIDWSQNDDHKSTVSVYSLRARERPTVSTPVTWEELDKAHKSGDGERLVFSADEVLKRVEKLGDLFEPVLRLKQKLPKGRALATAS